MQEPFAATPRGAHGLPDLEPLIDVLSQGLVVLDRGLRVVLWNRWMEMHSRLGRDEVLGKVLTEVFPELVPKGFAWKVQNVFALGNYAFFSQRLHRFLFPLSTAQYLQGRYENMQQNAVVSPLRGEDGQVEFVCVSILDCTDTVSYQERLEETTRRLEQMAQTDHLTQVANRRHLFDRLTQEISRTCRQNQPLSVAIIDVDHFKNVNDRHGHLCGDQVLLQLAEVLKNNVRPYDLVGRYGGEEFCLVLPETGLDDAVKLVERLRKLVGQYDFRHHDECLTITFSAGVSSTECEPRADADWLLSQADEALYKAKSAGRNQTGLAVANTCPPPQELGSA
jgi:diguanylate cyclase (GGDEF)-like protein